MDDEGDEHDRWAAEVSELATRAGRTVGVAESLTGGMVAAALARAEASGGWFRGGVVAYSSEVKHGLLGVPDGPVVSATAAEAMACGARRVLGADIAVATTGAGGPAEQDGRRPGTVFLATADATGRSVARHDLDGDPGRVCVVAASLALEMLARRLRDAFPDRDRG